MVFPASILSLADAVGAGKLKVAWGGTIGMAAGLNAVKADLIAALTKVGTSEASAADTPVADTFLGSSTPGKSKWRKIVSADITDGTIANGDLAGGIAYSKLSLAGALLTADLTAHAVSQVAQSSAGFSGTTGVATVANVGTALSITTIGSSDLLWLVTLTVAHSAGGAPRCSLGTKLDALADANVVRGSCATGAGETTLVTFGYAAGVSAGVHTIQPRWANVDASGTFTAYLGNILAVEHRR